MNKPTRCLICDIWIDANYVEPGIDMYGKRVCGDCLQGAVELCLVLLSHVDETSVTIGYARAIEAEQKRLKETL